MTYPVYVGVGAWQIHPHLFFESIAYFIALRLALRNFRQDTIPATQRSTIMIGGLVGALIGTKVLVILQHIDLFWQYPDQFWLLLWQGKTIVGAMLGALLGVELTKKLLRIKESTGDAFVYPLMVGTAIGRIGCFLTGLSDHTYGVATHLPWGIDFGDGIPRHPTQLYEILFLLGLIAVLKLRSRQPLRSGDLFKFYMTAYLSFRFLIDFIKPDFHPFLNLSAIQIACLLGLVYYRKTIPKMLNFKF
jgi:phosphatidylglycerol---prolipoprotein diacylglyceryl transferase